MVEITKYKPTQHKIKALIYGASGSGKTVFGASAPKPLFLSAEAGLLSTQKEIDVIEIKSLQDLQEAFEIVKKGVDYDTIIIDSISEINEIIKQGIEKKTGHSMQLQDWGELSKTIRRLLQSFRDLDYHVLLIAQEDEERDDDKIHKIVPMLNGKSAITIAYFMDIVAYISVNADGTRNIQTSSDPKLLAKDRTGKLGNNTKTFQDWVDIVEGSVSENAQKIEKLHKPTKIQQEKPVTKQIEQPAQKIENPVDNEKEETVDLEEDTNNEFDKSVDENGPLTPSTRAKIMGSWGQLKKKSGWSDDESETKRKATMLKMGIDSFSEKGKCTEKIGREFLMKVRIAIESVK